MVDFRNILLQSAKPAVSEIVAIQRDFLDGKGDIKYKGEAEEGILKSPATIGDERSQAIYVERLNQALGADAIYYKNEEEVDDAQARINAGREATARYRIAIDPIDGTGNYSGSKQEKDKRAPVNRSLDELTPQELAGGAVRPGWGSMVAIQERAPDGDWKTAASAIYESHSGDTPDHLKGKFYLSEPGKEGVSVINLQTGLEESVILARNGHYPNTVVQGGFPKIAGAKEAQETIKRHITSEGNALLDLSCVAQSALAVITGKASGFFQGHPSLHDVLAIAHLAEKAGLYVMVLDKNGDEPAVSVVKEGKIAIEYPVFIAARPELAIAMAEKYIEGAKLDKDKLTFRNGHWDAKGFEQLKNELLIRAAAQPRDWKHSLPKDSGSTDIGTAR